MSSPFPIPMIGSSPFPFSLPIPVLNQPSPSQGQGQVMTSGAGAIHAPSPLTQLLAASTPGLSGLYQSGQGQGTPGANLGGGGGTGNSPFTFAGLTPNTSALISASLAHAASATATATQIPNINTNRNTNTNTNITVNTGAGDGQGDGIQDILSTLDQVEGILERLLGLEREIADLKVNLFQDISKSDQLPTEQRLEILHAEFTQHLLSLLSLAQTNPIGALPLLPSTSTTTADLARWAENRAQVEFTRREALKNGGRAVLDVLKR